MEFGPDSKDADVIYFSTFAQFGRCLTFEQLREGDDDEFVRAWLDRAEARAWIHQDGDRWCLTESGATYWEALRPEMGIFDEFEIGLPVEKPGFRLFRRRRR